MTEINVIDVDKIGSATSPLVLAKTVALVSSAESPKAGDVVVVRSGDEAFRRLHPEWVPRESPHPGLHVSCLEWFRDKDIAAIAWIAGDWQGAPGRSQTEEHWLAPAGGAMLGTSRTIAGGKMVFFEFLRIETRADGIYYVAHPKARCPGTDFRLTRYSATEDVFENPQHDFPKRITYRKTGDDSLTATVDGGEGSKPTTFSFHRMKSNP